MSLTTLIKSRIVKFKHVGALACAILFFGLPNPALAQNRIISVAQDAFFETLNASQQVSVTGRLVGVLGNSGALDVQRPIVSVSGISANDKTICIDISHVSGVYIARARVSNPGLSGSASFRLPSRLMAQASRATKEYAVLVRASKSAVCHQRNDILLAGWGTREPKRDLLFAVSAAPTSSVNITMEGIQGRPNCQSAGSYFDSSTTTFQRFSRICEVKLAPSCSAKSRFELVIEESGARVPMRRRSLRRSCDS